MFVKVYINMRKWVREGGIIWQIKFIDGRVCKLDEEKSWKDIDKNKFEYEHE